MNEPVIVVEDYTFWYKLPGGERALALEDVSFQIDAGDFVLILGTSGSGKSTLALNLVGILPDYFGGWNAGRIQVRHPERGLINRRELTPGERFSVVNILFQNPEDQIVTLTVEEEIGFALENYLMPPGEISERVDHALELVGIPDFRSRSTMRLSGGEKQRVALAAMLAMSPRVLILDEPTSNLDPLGKEQVLDAVRRIRERSDVTILIVEHEVDEVFDSVNRVLLVDQKRVTGPSPTREFMREHGLEVRDRMGLWIPQASEVALELERHEIRMPGEVPLTGAELQAGLAEMLGAGATPASSAAQPDTVVLTDRPSTAGGDDDRPQSPAPVTDPVIAIRDVSFSYGTRSDVLRKVSFDIRRNELLAIVGQNGSGKSTLAAQLNGILRPSAGEVLVDGKPTTAYKFAKLAQRVAYIFQVPEKQFIRQTVHEELAHSLRTLKIDEAEIETRVAEMLERIHLTDRKDFSPYVLSHGQKRRLSVACMVISEPEVIVLDEPTFGQDYRQARRIMEFMRDLADSGSAVVFITHDMRLVGEYADRCVAMCAGEAIFEGSPVALFEAAEVLERTRLKIPPVMAFCERMLGRTVLTTDEAVDLILEGSGGRLRSRL